MFRLLNNSDIWPWDYDLQQTAIRSSHLPLNSFHPRNQCNYMDYYSFIDAKGMEGWVALLVDP